MLEAESFKDAALEEIAKIIGDSYTGSEIFNFFSRTGHNLVLDSSTKWKYVYSTLLEIKKNKYGYHDILNIIKIFCDPQAFISNPELHEKILVRINKVFHFYALEISNEGSLMKRNTKRKTLEAISEDIKIFDVRKFHSQIVLHSRKPFIDGNYSNSVFESCKAYDKQVRVFSKIDDHGASLMGRAFSEKGPIKINAQQTTTEKNEQEGIMQLSRGLMFAVRNPQGHEPALDWPISLEEALDLLSFLSYLFRKLENSSALIDNQIHRVNW